MELVILAGLQASGKTSFRKLYFDSTHIVVSKDNFGRNRKNKQALQESFIREALGSGRSVVVDNTNARVQDRRVLIDIGREFSAVIKCYHLKSTVSESLIRNEGRTGRARVDVVGIYSTAKIFVYPSLYEGYDELYEVVFDHLDTFVIKEVV